MRLRTQLIALAAALLLCLAGTAGVRASALSFGIRLEIRPAVRVSDGYKDANRGDAVASYVNPVQVSLKPTAGTAEVVPTHDGAAAVAAGQGLASTGVAGTVRTVTILIQ